MFKNAIAGTLAFSFLALVACDKKEDGANTTSTTGATAAKATTAAPAAAAVVDCEKVIEKIASLNPPDSRGEIEKKMWRSMCAQMKPEEKTCVMGAKAMADMKACMKN